MTQSVTADEDTPKTITLRGTDSNGDSLTFSIASNSTHGTPGIISPVNATASTVTYTPAADYGGADSFTFKVTDDIAVSNEATISITINPITSRYRPSS